MLVKSIIELIKYIILMKAKFIIQNIMGHLGYQNTINYQNLWKI